MPRLQEASIGGSLCQDSQYCGVFLQAAVSSGVYLSEYRLLALLRRNSVRGDSGGEWWKMCWKGEAYIALFS